MSHSPETVVMFENPIALIGIVVIIAGGVLVLSDRSARIVFGLMAIAGAIVFLVALTSNGQRQPQRLPIPSTKLPSASIGGSSEAPPVSLPRDGLLTPPELIAAFPGWDVSGKTVVSVINGDKAFLTISTAGTYIEWAEMQIFTAKNIADLSDEDLQPFVTMLRVIAPDNAFDENWVRNTFTQLPAPTGGRKPVIGTWNGWEFKGDKSKSGFILTVSQTRSIPKPSVTPNKPETSRTTTPNPIGPDEFAKIMVNAGKPLVTTVRVDADNGPAVSISDAKFLLVTVSNDWYLLTIPDKKELTNSLLSTFQKWSGNQDAILIVWDKYKEEVATGNKFGIKVKP